MTYVNKLNKAKAGDFRAIEQICLVTWEPLYRFIYYKVQNREEAEDIIQETYVKTLTYLKEHETPQDNLLGYMKTVALNILRDRWRQRKRRGIPVSFEEVNTVETAGMDHQIAIAQVRRAELWSDGDKYAVRQEDGVLTVNNGERKWQIRPESKEVALLPPVPDPVRTGFDLRDEAKLARQYPHTVAGSEMIAGRQTTKLEIAPPGGLTYYLWIDQETNLPVQLQTAMQNALQTTYTFVNFKPNTQIEANIFTYQTPEGYQVVEEDPGQLVATVEEAAAISRLALLLPREAPDRIFAFKDRIVLEYGDTTIVETFARGDFEPAANASLGSAAGGPLEVWWERLRWRQDDLEIQVEGPRRVDLAGQIAPGFTLPDTGEKLVNKARVEVPVDMEIIKANQQQVDRGSSPWQLDPLQVSLTFVNLKVSPEGITGEPKVPMESFELVANNGAEAVIAVDGGTVSKVYLQRLIRQDETGIWTVTGYDPR